MDNSVKLEVWGDLAAFNRPEMKVERVSYEVMTPSAARGVLEAIYWKPQMRWVIDGIRVLRPIRFTHVRRNEVSSKISAKVVAGAMKAGSGVLGLAVDDRTVRAQRAAMILQDVRYGIAAHVEVLEPDKVDGRVNSNPIAKHLEMFRRRAARGQCFHRPYLGTRECPAQFELVDDFSPCPSELIGDHDLGFVLLDVQFVPDAKGTVVEAHGGRRCTAVPRFFHALMRDGAIEVPRLAGSEVMA